MIVRTVGVISIGHDIPSCPNRMHVHPLGNIDNELDIGVVVVVGASWNLGNLLTHSEALHFRLDLHLPQHTDPPYEYIQHWPASPQG